MFYSEVTHKHGSMPFNLRNFEDKKKAKLAVVECVNHKLIEPFQVLYDKSGMFHTTLSLRLCVKGESAVWRKLGLVLKYFGAQCKHTVVRRMASSWMLHLVALVRTDVLEELSAFFIRVTRISELGTTLAVTSN
jgi:hypothetical protein